MQSDPNSADYYRKREAQERGMAERAEGPAIRNIHLKMANIYRMLAEEAARLEPDHEP